MYRLTDIFINILGLFNFVTYIIISLAVVFFLIGLVRYLASSSDASSRADARGMIVNGIIILFVMVSLWGLVNIISQTFGIRSENAPRPFPVYTPNLIR